MYRIRLHGRGGQGMKTASRILGTAFFDEGFEVQDAPRYGAERRGAPIFAFVRAARQRIHERGVIQRPDLVVVADDTLVPVAAAGVTAGVGDRTVLLIASTESADTWRERLAVRGPVFALPISSEERSELRFVGATAAAAAARLLGAIGRESLEAAIRQELASLGEAVVGENLARALAAWDAFEPHAGAVREGPDAAVAVDERPDWIDVPFDAARISAPDIHAAATSVEVRTGLWRTLRPVIDPNLCHGCTWICSTFCPDGAISRDASGAPVIDYDHCKGCLVCVAVCPHHAIHAIPEQRAAAGGAPRDSRAPS